MFSIRMLVISFYLVNVSAGYAQPHQPDASQATQRESALPTREDELGFWERLSLMMADKLNEQVKDYYQQGKYQLAIPLAERVLAILKKTLGEEHPDVATSLNNLAELYYSMGMYARAEPLYQRALYIRQKHLGEEHSLVAASLNNLAALYQKMGEYARAEPLYLRALEIKKKNLGEEHPSVATSLNNLALLYQTKGEYARAELFYLGALEIRKKVLGNKHYLVATSLNNLALLYQTKGEYARAEPLYLRALEILKKTLGEEHPSVATSLNNLAGLYQTMGEYARAKPLYIRALEMKTKTLGEEHPDVAQSLNNLAVLYESMGEYARSEPLFLRVLEIQKKTLGEEHSMVAASLNQAMFFQTMGDYARAEPIYLRALEIQEKILGKEHPSIATSLNNLALLYQTMGEYAHAEQLYLRALKIREKTLGEEHPDVANSLINLAVLYRQMGKYARAEPLFLRALEILKKTLGKEHPDVANSLSNLAVLYRQIGEYARAEPLYLRALEINKKNLGEEHSLVATSLNNLAVLYFYMGEYVRAKPLYKKTLFIAIQNDKPQLLWTVQSNLSGLLAAQNQLDAAIFWGKQSVNRFQTTRLKAREMDKQLQKSFMKQEDYKYHALAVHLLTRQRFSEVQQVLTMLKEREYADFVQQRDPKSDPRSTQVAYTDFEQTWTTLFEVLKKQLAQIGPKRNWLQLKAKKQDLSETEKQRLTVLNNQLQGLEKDFYTFLDQLELVFQTPPPVQFQGQPQPSSLPALQKLLKQLGNGVVLLEYLVTKKKLHLLVTTTNKQIHRSVPVSEDDLNQGITRFRNLMNVDKTDTNTKPESARLYNWLIKLIANVLKQANAKTLLLSLDGKLRYLPMAALYNTESTQYLVEQYTLIRYTQAGKHLINRPQKPSQLAVVGLGLSEEIEGFEPLDAVEDELNGIIRQNEDDDEGVTDGVIYLNQDFNTDNLQKSLQQAEFPFMHIASHFVFGENEQKSYLLLGDGSPLSLKTLRKDYQFKYLDLLTLSACNTAMGKDTTGKEIDGLSVTVQENGAKAVIATLWPVYDDSTGEFMQKMYELHVEDGLSQAAAIRQTQQEFIEEGDYDHPYYWAPFILMGNGL
jgi:CHAT domain-containing protein/Tfp pilus assembly protein PilF